MGLCHNNVAKKAESRITKRVVLQKTESRIGYGLVIFLRIFACHKCDITVHDLFLAEFMIKPGKSSKIMT